MKFRYFPAIIFILVLFACRKNSSSSSPQVTIKSITPNPVSQGNVIEMDAKFNDKAGTLDSALVVLKWYDNSTATFIDTMRFPLGGLNLPTTTKLGDIIVQFGYGQFVANYPVLPNSPVAADTTATLGLILIDQSGNRSGYGQSGKIRLLH